MVTTRAARLALAQVMAGATLLLALIYTAGFYDSAMRVGRGTTLFAIALSILAFGASLKIRSGLVAGVLIASGAIILIPPVIAILDAGAVTIPGPILGVIFFSPILVLGVVKALGARSRTKHVPQWQPDPVRR